jgi:TPR repeat
MLTCPMCKQRLLGLERECSRCHTDVSLLVDYVENLQDGLVRADALTKQGELGEAVWAYLEVLEVDPDNATARRQVGQVVTAVRQFDRAAPGRRWFNKIRRQTRLRRWAAGVKEVGSDSTSWLGGLVLFGLVMGALVCGYVLGIQALPKSESRPPTTAASNPPAPAPSHSPAGADK